MHFSTIFFSKYHLRLSVCQKRTTPLNRELNRHVTLEAFIHAWNIQVCSSNFNPLNCNRHHFMQYSFMWVIHFAIDSYLWILLFRNCVQFFFQTHSLCIPYSMFCCVDIPSISCARKSTFQVFYHSMCSFVRITVKISNANAGSFIFVIVEFGSVAEQKKSGGFNFPFLLITYFPLTFSLIKPTCLLGSFSSHNHQLFDFFSRTFFIIVWNTFEINSNNNKLHAIDNIISVRQFSFLVSFVFMHSHCSIVHTPIRWSVHVLSHHLLLMKGIDR